MGFAAGFSSAYTAVSNARERREKREAAATAQAEKLKKEGQKALLGIQSKQTALAKAQGAFASDVAAIRADETLDQKVKIDKINALGKKHGAYIGSLKQEISMMTKFLPQDAVQAVVGSTQQIGQEPQGLAQIVVGGKTTTVSEPQAKQIQAMPKESTKVGSDGNIEITDKDGNTQGVIPTINLDLSIYGTEKQKKIKENISKYDLLTSQMTKHKTLDQTDLYRQRKQERDAIVGELVTDTRGAWKPRKFTAEDKKKKQIYFKQGHDTNKGESDRLNAVYGIIDEGLINFQDNNDLKSMSSMMLKIGAPGLQRLHERIMEKKGADYAEALFLPLLKAEEANKGTHATEALYSDKILDMVAALGNQESEEFKNGGFFGYVKRTADFMKSGAGNQKVIQSMYKNDVEPLVMASEGKSGEYYAKDWAAAGKQYDRKYAGLGSDLPGMGGFGDVTEAIDSLQDYIDDYAPGLRNFISDVTSTHDSNMEAFMNVTFPKLQVAYKTRHPEKPLLTPMDMLDMIGKDYESNKMSDYGKPKQGSELYNIINIANQIQF